MREPSNLDMMLALGKLITGFVLIVALAALGALAILGRTKDDPNDVFGELEPVPEPWDNDWNGEIG